VKERACFWSSCAASKRSCKDAAASERVSRLTIALFVSLERSLLVEQRVGTAAIGNKDVCRKLHRPEGLSVRWAQRLFAHNQSLLDLVVGLLKHASKKQRLRYTCARVPCDGMCPAKGLSRKFH
jgi:hypothetical protein